MREFRFSCRILALLMFMFCLTSVAQTPDNATKEVTGIVTDAMGDPLVGVSVLVKGKQIGTSTNARGLFVLHVEADQPKVTLVFSYIGMKKQEVVWKGLPLKVTLEDDENALDEVVVTGFGNVDARKNTTAITSLNMDDILMPGMTSIEQALEGRVPDLVFMQNSGEVGSTARMRIRGTSTLIGNREPLWVLDGIPLSDPVDVSVEQLNDPDYVNYIGNAISGINPQDIERIDVLKDAAATALYGTRAANGVIVVTTKKGQAGPPTINYSMQLKLIQRPRYTDHNINLMNSQERVQFGKDLCDMHYRFPVDMTTVGYEGAYNDYVKGNISYDEFESRVRLYESTNTDWFKILTRDALTQNHSLSISGGNDFLRYYTSLGYTNEEGVLKTQYNDRYTASARIQSQIHRNLQVNVRFNGSISKKNYLPDEVQALDYAYNTTRALPCFNPDGSLYFYKKHAYDTYGTYTSAVKNSYNKYNYNIINEMENTSKKYDASQFIVALDMQYRLKNLFDFTATASYQRGSSTTDTWYGENSNYVAQLKNGEVDDLPIQGVDGKCELPYGGVLNTSGYTNENLTLRLQANYHQYLDGDNKHLVGAMLGYEVNAYRNNGYSDRTLGYFKDRGMKYIESMTREEVAKFPYYADWMSTVHRKNKSEKTNKLSGYLTLTYSYGYYFTLNANGRFDASNKFGSRSNEKFLPVWSVSGMFNAKETFMQDITQVDDLRIRASYGVTGNMVDGQTPNLLISQGSLNSFYGENYSTVYAFPNPNLRWEQTRSLNGGLDMSFFDRRLMIGGDVYYKKTKDAFTTVPVSATNGVTQLIINGGNITNRGFSISVQGYPVRTRDWRWYLSTNYSLVKNKVENDVVNEYGLQDYLSGTAIVSGESVGTFYSYKYLGLNPSNGVPMFDDYKDRRYLLENKSLEEIVKLIMVNSGNREPRFTGALYSTLTWKQLSLNTNFNYSLGNKIRLFPMYTEILYGISSESNVRKEFNDRWKVPGDETRTDYPALIGPAQPEYQENLTHWSSVGTTETNKFKAFANSTWQMYDNSDYRVVSGNYLRLSQLTLRYNFMPRQLKRTPIKTLTVDFSTNNVFTLCSSRLKGQDPSQTGFSAATVLSTRPSYTFGLQVSF